MTRVEVTEHGYYDHDGDRRSDWTVQGACGRGKKICSYLADDENFPNFAIQLQKLGLQLRDVPADGNCLFRALGDQLEGHGRNHYRLRIQTVQYMAAHHTDFEPFIEDDVSFKDYVATLKNLGMSAGNDAIVSFAKLHNINVVIHQLEGKPLLIQGGSSSDAGIRQIHIAYHNGHHYSSVRLAGDNTESPANIVYCADRQAVPSANDDRDGDTCTLSDGVVKARRSVEQMVLEVLTATGCKDEGFVRQVLNDYDYNVDACIAVLLGTVSMPAERAGDAPSRTSHRHNDALLHCCIGGQNIGVGTGRNKHSLHYL